MLSLPCTCTQTLPHKILFLGQVSKQIAPTTHLRQNDRKLDVILEFLAKTVSTQVGVLVGNSVLRGWADQSRA